MNDPKSGNPPLVKLAPISKLKIVSFNARCLSNKFAHLPDLVDELEPDLVAITETWLTCDITNQEFVPHGFTCFRLDRQINFYSAGTYQRNARGGVLILVKEGLNVVLIEDQRTQAEILWIKMFPDETSPVIVGVCYRPEVDEDIILERICHSISSISRHENCDIVLTGDFNFRGIEWESLQGTSTRERLFLETLSENLLSQIISEPTRDNNILDLLITNNTDSILSVSVLPPFSSSDHNIICAELSRALPRVETQHRRIFLYSEGDYTSLQQEIRQINWEDLFENKSMEEAWEIFKSTYNRLILDHIPHKDVHPGLG